MYKTAKKISKSSVSKAIAIFALLQFMALMLAKPAYYLTSARKGLSLFATSVLPSLFPFYFCSLMLTYMGAVSTISELGRRGVRALYNTPKESAYALFLSMLCGYPVGASTICELYQNGVIDKRDVKSASAFCSTSGPIFMIGTIGGAIFSNAKFGWIVLFSHYLGALINGIIYRKRNKSKEKDVKISALDVDGVLSSTISKATINMLYVGGYVVLCGMIVDTLELIGLSNVTNAFSNDIASAIKSIIYGSIEMTRGVIESANCQNIRLSSVLCTSAVSFGGLSITLQNYTFLSKCGMSIFEILLRKITQCAISALLAFVLSFAL